MRWAQAWREPWAWQAKLLATQNMQRAYSGTPDSAFTCSTLEARTRQRRQRELPSGQSLQFSPSTLGAARQARTRGNAGQAGILEDKLHLWGRRPMAQFSCKNIRRGKKHVVGKESIVPSHVFHFFFCCLVTLLLVFSGENPGAFVIFFKCKYKLTFSGGIGTSVFWVGD